MIISDTSEAMALKVWQRIVLFLAGLLNWIALPRPSGHGRRQDPSWELALAHFLRNKFQAGIDYIYTYGPLGYVLTATYDRSLYWLKYGWELSIKLLFVVVLWKISQRFRDFAIDCSSCLSPPRSLHFCRRSRRALPVLLFAGSLYLPAAIFGAFCGVFALTKFSFILPIFFLLGIVTVHRRSAAALIVFTTVFSRFG